ncbi:MAG: C39 family peptidase [Synechococcales cyanobacterium K44_A2020_017]|jgi:uncharacterized protein YvpB|nr:C39 family peptidase [Synechococcales cyanobacterium K32_A2020_035]MBF2095339.1 C39 family peptidase [Synechococcales cyanobacterium K44_A2020_017]
MVKLLRVTVDTVLKRRTEQSSNLPEQEQYRAIAGQEFPIASYAYASGGMDFNGHVKVALDGQTLNGFNTWYIYDRHAQIFYDGKAVYPPPDKHAPLRKGQVLVVTQNTMFKLRPVQSSQLSETERCQIPIGTQFEIQSYAYASAGQNFDNHIRISLKNQFLRGRNTWYVYTPHARVEQDGKMVYPVVAKRADKKPLAVPYFSQRDNYIESWRTCNSSACAMAARFLGAAIANDNDYLRKVVALGDTTDHAVQTRVLQSYGIRSAFHYNLDYEDLDRSLDQGKPIVIGILHRGPITAPSGGHMIVVVGQYDAGYVCHDPYGSVHDGYSGRGGQFEKYSRELLNARWLTHRRKNGWGRLFE